MLPLGGERGESGIDDAHASLHVQVGQGAGKIRASRLGTRNLVIFS